MATAVTHLYFADRCLQEGKLSQKRAPFLAGNCFPDIRYLAGLDRGRTHLEKADFNSICQATSFKAGMLTHHWLDLARGKGLETATRRRGYPHENSFYLGLKFWEDTYFYPQVIKIPDLKKTFAKVYPEELAFANRETVQEWHKILGHYFSQAPSPNSMRTIMTAVGIDQVTIGGTLAWFKKIDKDRPLQKLAISFYRQLKFG